MSADKFFTDIAKFDGADWISVGLDSSGPAETWLLTMRCGEVRYSGSGPTLSAALTGARAYRDSAQEYRR